MPRVRLTPSFVKTAACPPTKDRALFWDHALPTFALMVTKLGHKSWVYQYRNRRGKGCRLTIGDATPLSLEQARKIARGYVGDVARGIDPLAVRRSERGAGKTTLRSVCADFFEREAKTLRSAKQWAAVLERCVYGKLGNRQIEDVANKRGLIVALLDDIAVERGPGMARVVHTLLGRILNWYAARTDNFAVTTLRGLRRAKSEPRSRILSDDELARVWHTAEGYAAPWGVYTRFLLLTACRRNEAAQMQWDELDGDTWIIPAARSKTKTEIALPLSPAAQSLLASLPRIEGCPFVFTTDGRRAVGGFSKFKKSFDAACGVSGWTIHDLRRTSRSLLSRAGISADVSERCLGHKLSGVRGVYDRYSFRTEMLHGFIALASLISRIVDPPADVVTPLRAKP